MRFKRCTAISLRGPGNGRHDAWRWDCGGERIPKARVASRARSLHLAVPLHTRPSHRCVGVHGAAPVEYRPGAVARRKDIRP